MCVPYEKNTGTVSWKEIRTKAKRCESEEGVQCHTTNVEAKKLQQKQKNPNQTLGDPTRRHFLNW